MFTDDLVTWLQGEGVATLGTTMFVSSKAGLPPPTAPAFLTVVATPSIGPLYLHDQRTTSARDPRAQLNARAETEASAAALAAAAYNACARVLDRVINGVRYLWIRPLQEPFDGGLDANGRIQIKFNVEARHAS